jgi:hypothetical protein
MRNVKYIPLFFLCVAVLMIAPLACDRETGESADPYDQPPEAPVTEGPGSSLPWETAANDPVVTLRNPERGHLVSTNDVYVRGIVDGTFPARVTVEGQTLPVESDGRFEGTVAVNPQGPVLSTTARAKANGVESADRAVVFLGESLPESELIHDAMGAHLTQRFLDLLSAELSERIPAIDFTPILEQINPIIQALGVTIEIPNLEIGGLEIAVPLADGSLRIEAGIEDLYVELNVLIGPLAISGSALTEKIDFSARASFPDPGSGPPSLSLSNVQTTIQGMDLQIEGIPDLLVNLVEGLVADGLELLVRILFSTAIEGVLDGILQALTFEVPLGNLSVAAQLETVKPTVAALAVTLSANLMATQPDPEMPGGIASLFTPGALPVPTETVPGTTKPYDLALILGDDILNRAFHSLTRSGLFALNENTLPIEVSAGSLGELFPSLADIDPQLPVHLALSPGAPPIITTEADGDRVASLALLDYRLSVSVETGQPEFGDWEAFLVSTDILAEAGLVVDEPGRVSIDLALPDFSIEVLRNPIREERLILIENATALIGPAFDAIADQIKKIKISLPPILGYKIVPVSLGAEGENSDALTLYLSFEAVQ